MGYKTMRTFLLSLAVIFASVPATRVTAAEAARPNILYFYVDDMGWGSIGPNAQAQRKANNLPYVRTPDLDRLAAEGINFTRGYGCHVCSPARSSQQSGFHQGHTFADRNDPNNAKKAMRADDILIGDALSAAGYATGYWGKWGYGGSTSQYNSQLFSRTHYLDWWKLLEDVKKEARSVQDEETRPKELTREITGPDTKGLSR